MRENSLLIHNVVGARNVYTIGYTFFMLIETLSVREAREQLPSVLERFRSGDRTPVGVGSHRKTEAVMVPVEVFDELTAERSRALAQAAASVRAEGLAVGADVETIMQRWTRGEVSTAEMRKLIRDLYGAS
jgi:PHD/YefM family antitoxin component YafN of YafNO toxin-antitoxin module